jgi:DnaJ like chaperone protein
MRYTAVVLGALLGLAFTRNVWGGVIGAILGYLLDQSARVARHTGARPLAVRSEFLRATFQMMGHIAKSDGRVSESEIDAARRLMEEFRLDARETEIAMECFRVGKSPAFQPQMAIDRLREACARRSDLLRHFMDLQLRAAMLGNGISPPVRAKLMRVAEELGFSGLEFAYMEVSVRAQFSRARGAGPQPKKRNSLDECYAELQVDATISDAELKKAYRRQMSRHHPDKLVANGLPESMAQWAKEKTQRIQEAYEGIRAARGMR